MTQEEKHLLLVDLCARLPYGVIILHEGWSYEWDDSLSTQERVIGIDDEFVYTKVIDSYTKEEYKQDKHTLSLFDDKPYLRPMSSMTEEEKCGFNSYYNIFNNNPVELIDWLNFHHFDYRGLIEKGLAIAVTKENNPYEQDHVILYIKEGELNTCITLESDRQMKRLGQCIIDLDRTDGRQVSIGEE